MKISHIYGVLYTYILSILLTYLLMIPLLEASGPKATGNRVLFSCILCFAYKIIMHYSEWVIGLLSLEPTGPRIQISYLEPLQLLGAIVRIVSSVVFCCVVCYSSSSVSLQSVRVSSFENDIQVIESH